jgi:hypothetical protein
VDHEVIGEFGGGLVGIGAHDAEEAELDSAAGELVLRDDVANVPRVLQTVSRLCIVK